MNSYILRVNCNHLRKQIDTDYLAIRNHLYLCVLASLCVLNTNEKVLPYLAIEDSYYQTALDHALSTDSVQSAIAALGVVAPPRQFLEIHEHVEEFFRLKLVDTRRNYVSVTIDSGYHLVVNLKLI